MKMGARIKHYANEHDLRKRNEVDRKYKDAQQYTLCPRCKQYVWWYQNRGLKYQECNCGYVFTGRERNPIAKKAVTADGVVHKAWRGSEQRSVVHLECEIRAHGQFGPTPKQYGRPIAAETNVTCILCLDILEE